MTRQHESQPHADALQRVGTVRAIGEASVTVDLDDGEDLEARRAVSCLVAPEAGDVVLLVLSPRGAHVLAVLERSSSGPVRVDAPGDLELHARGALRLRARGPVAVVSAESMEFTAPAAALRTVEGAVNAERVVLSGAVLHACFARVRATLDDLDLRSLRVSTQTRWSMRRVEETDHVRAGRIDYGAETVLRLRADNAVVHARSLVKVDGDQIHLG